jgi:hypothetical protein
VTTHTADADQLVPQLLARTNELTVAMIAAESAYLGYAALDTQVKDIRGAYEHQAASDPALKNAEQRKAAVHERMTGQWSHLLADLDRAEQEKYSTAQDVARAAEEVKTLRTVLMYQASANELEAAQITAGAMPRLIRNR